MRWIRCFLMFVGRFFLGLAFLWAAVEKIMNFDAATQMVADKGFSEAAVFVIGACVVELLGGLSLIFGYRTRWGAFVLALFLIPTTMIYHRFWEVGEAHRQVEILLFLKNLAIFGGLLYVIACGASEHKKVVEEEH